jgi:hypothetical protein
LPQPWQEHTTHRNEDGVPVVRDGIDARIVHHEVAAPAAVVAAFHKAQVDRLVEACSLGALFVVERW